MAGCLIPPTIFAREDLSLREKVLMGRLLGLMTNTGYIKKDTAFHLLTSLVRKNLLSIELIKNSAGQITERRAFPRIDPSLPAFVPPKKTGKNIVKSSNRGGIAGNSFDCKRVN